MNTLDTASDAPMQRKGTPMGQIKEFLDKNSPFYLATVDGDQPKLRPLGASMEIDGTVYFGVGDFKEVYKQLVANPKCEIATTGEGGYWLRYTGTAKFEETYELAEKMLDGAPNLRNIYNDETGNKMMVFHLEDAKAVIIHVMGEGEPVEC